MTRDETETFLILKYGSVLIYFDMWVRKEVEPTQDEFECFGAMLDDGTLF